MVVRWQITPIRSAICHHCPNPIRPPPFAPMIPKTILTLTIAAILAGCASAGRKFDTQAASQIQKGTTTKAQVQQLVGLPQNIGKDSDGNETWTYAYARSTAKGTSFIPIAGAFMGGADTQEQKLVVKFDPAGVVTYTDLSFGGMSMDTGATAGQAPATPGVAK